MACLVLFFVLYDILVERKDRIHNFLPQKLKKI